VGEPGRVDTARYAMPPRGRVVEPASGLGLAGMVLHWVLPTTNGSRLSGADLLLGTARSDDDGVFEVLPDDSRAAREALCRLACYPDVRSRLVVDDDEGGLLDATTDVSGDSGDVVVQVKPGRIPTAEQWRSLGEYLAANRMQRGEQLDRQLAAPLEDGPTREWPAGVRAAGLGQVRGAFVRGGTQPETVASWQDRLLDLSAFLEGDLDKAVNRFGNVVAFERYGGTAADWYRGIVPELPTTDLELYRDYLRGVWVTAAQRMHKWTPPLGAPNPAPKPLRLENQLARRFHQDFRTPDTQAKPVHALLIPLLRAILTARGDREGFGMAPAAIPPQGARSDDAYVATLVGLSGVSALELRNRLRVRFERPVTERVSPVQLNVEALLGLLSDTFQSPEEPFPTEMPGHAAVTPLVFGPYAGRAPFFLQYEEWLERQGRFHAENVYDVRRTIPHFDKPFRDAIAAQKGAPHSIFTPGNSYFASQADWQDSAAWVERSFGIVDAIRDALKTADLQDYAESLRKLDHAARLIDDADKAQLAPWRRDSFPWVYPGGAVNDNVDRRVSLKDRAARPVNTPAELKAFEAWFDAFGAPGTFSTWNDLEKWLARLRTLTIHQLPYLKNVLLPYLRSTIYATLGDHARAANMLESLTGYEVGIGRATDSPGYVDKLTPPNQPYFLDGDALPYTVAVEFQRGSRLDVDLLPYYMGTPPLIAPFEQRFFRLAQGEVMLAWADELYRNDDASSIRRARELYKGVLFLHGEDPEIAPYFGEAGGPLGFQAVPLATGPHWAARDNPARLSQVARARLGFAQIEEGLNAYGFSADMVPLLRYKPLKQSADLFATSAKSAQTDFIGYMTRFEQAQIEGWQTTALLKKAEASAGIATEHIEIAKFGVAKAQEQVAAVKAQIAAKQQEIADADDFFSQAKDFFGGMKDAVAGMIPLAEKVGGGQSPAQAVTGAQLQGILTKTLTSTTAGKEAAVAALGSGAALTIGFGAFAYAGYTSLSSMADAANRRSADLKALQQVALPAAEAQVRLKERDVTIARHQLTIAQADVALARTLDRFQRDRFLNVDLWNKLAGFAHRLMRRYLELGARTAWLAERALAYEQTRDLRIIRLNYMPNALRGLTGADRLLLDLAELEATRLQGVRLSTPVKHTLSLARDFPVAFGQLKLTGQCVFHSWEGLLRAAYPGTFGYRVRTITVAAQDPEGPPPRGILRNLGVSSVSGEDGTVAKSLVRFPDALPLSEFRLHDDLFVYGLPGETLLQFEGSGFETDWEVAFPPAMNPRGLRALSDVLVTFDLNASYSRALGEQVGAAAGLVVRSVLMAASVFDADGLASLRAPDGPARIRFDVTRLTLSAQETNRRIANLAIMAVGKTHQTYQASLRAGQAGLVAFPIDKGLALSNGGALQGTNPPAALNALLGAKVDQVFTLEIDRSGVADELKALLDVLLFLEYEADL
jgi:hypothetical protein